MPLPIEHAQVIDAAIFLLLARQPDAYRAGATVKNPDAPKGYAGRCQALPHSPVCWQGIGSRSGAVCAVPAMQALRHHDPARRIHPGRREDRGRRANLQARHPGAPRGGGAARGRVPCVAECAARRIRRRRRLLRDLGLPDHRVAAEGGRVHRADRLRGILCAADQAPAPGGGADGHDDRNSGRAVPVSAGCQGLRVDGDRRGLVREQHLVRGAFRRLPAGRPAQEPAASHLVARGRGTVLPGVAGADRRVGAGLSPRRRSPRDRMDGRRHFRAVLPCRASGSRAPCRAGRSSACPRARGSWASVRRPHCWRVAPERSTGPRGARW